MKLRGRALVAAVVVGLVAPVARADGDIATMIQAITIGDAGTSGTMTYYIDHLSNTIGVRITGTQACEDACVWIESELESFTSPGGDPVYSVSIQEWTLGGHSGKNVIADLPGLDGSNLVYIVCAHYDSQPVGLTPGADDNASGTAALLCTAKALAESGLTFSHRIRFIAFSGEEEGELGSNYYADQAGLAGMEIAAVLNFDMAGYYDLAVDPSGDAWVRVWENADSLWLTDFIQQVADEYYGDVQLSVWRGLDGPGQGEPHPASDQQPFWDHCYDGVWFHEYTHNPYYHTVNDTLANMKVDYATKVARLTAASLAELARAGTEDPDDISLVGGDISINGSLYALDGRMQEFPQVAPGYSDLSGYLLMNDVPPPPIQWIGLPPIYHTTGYFEPSIDMLCRDYGRTIITFSGPPYVSGTLSDDWEVVQSPTVEQYTHTFSSLDGGLLIDSAIAAFQLPIEQRDIFFYWADDGTAWASYLLRAEATMAGGGTQLIEVPVMLSLAYTAAPGIPLPAVFKGWVKIESIDEFGDFTGRAYLGRSADMDCNGVVDSFDIAGFVNALTNKANYEGSWPDCNWLNADCNDDGDVDAFDIAAFIAILTGG